MRELRGGLSGFYVFIACIALGVTAIAGVGSLAAGLADSLSRQGQVILGGDLSFTLIQREATPQELSFLQSRGTVSAAATLRAMARAGNGQATLVELKAVDDTYPLYGTTQLAPEGKLAERLAEHDGQFGAVADPTLMARLNLAVGDRLTVGNAQFQVRASLSSEPDKLAGGIGFGPRLMISAAGLRATGLLQPGSLVHWHYRLRVPAADDSAVHSIVAQARSAFPQAGWEIHSRDNASPRLERDVNRFTQFLTIIGLTALLVGGVGVGNAVKAHLDRKRETIATMKALGASGRRIVAVYLTQVMLLALAGAIIGLVLGAILPFAVARALADIVPLPIEPSLQPGQLALALLYGLLTALTFAIWPLGRARDVRAGELFRDEVAPQTRWPRSQYIVLTLVSVGALAGLAVLLAYDRRVAVIFVATAAAVFAVLRVFAALLMFAAAHLKRPRAISLRMAIANLHRVGALTPTVVLSLGLGITLLVTVIEIDGNLRQQFSAALPDKAPSFYFLDIPANAAEKFASFVQSHAPSARFEDVPMLRGRIVAARGVPAEKLVPSDSAAWALQSDRGITYAADLPKGSRLAAGTWWASDYSGPPLLSFEKSVADGLGLKVGDPVTVNVLGRDITARIANLRTVDWQSLAINFVLVYSPHAFDGAPATHLATLTYRDGGTPDEEGAILRAVAAEFPMVTAVRVKEALQAIGGIVANLIVAIRTASGVTLLAAVFVLGGALAAGHRARVYDAVIMKTLGATRARLIAIYATEYSILGAATVLFGTFAGSLSAWLIVSALMHLRFTWLPVPALVTALVAVLVTVALGLAGTFAALGQKPAPVLRNL